MECGSSSACRLSMPMGRSFPLPINAQQIRAIFGWSKKEFVHLVTRRDKSTKSETRHSRISQLKIPSQATTSIRPNGNGTEVCATRRQRKAKRIFLVFRWNIAAITKYRMACVCLKFCPPETGAIDLIYLWMNFWFLFSTFLNIWRA